MIESKVSHKERISKTNVFDFSDYKEYLMVAGLPDGLYQHSSNTLQRWANRLGYKSPSSLTMVLKGQRSPSMDMIHAFERDLGLKGKEKEYFELLITLERYKKKDKDIEPVLVKLQKLSNNKKYFDVNFKKFNSMSKWYFLVLKQLVSSPLFIEDYDWISKRLRKKISPLQAKHAIKAMIELKLIGRDKNGKLFVEHQSVKTTNDIPSYAIKNHHEGMLHRAAEALHEQPIEERQINSLTFRMDPVKVPQAKEELFNFLKEFNEKYSCDESDDVFQLNIQMFQHTKAETPKARIDS